MRGRIATTGLALAIGVAAWEDIYHRVFRGGEESMPGMSHGLLHAVLAVPLAFFAVVVARYAMQRLAGGRRVGPEFNALGIAVVFALVLIPAAFVHPTLHRVLPAPLGDGAPMHAHMHMPSASEASPITHALQDALVAFPMAFFVAFAMAGGIAWRRPRLGRVQLAPLSAASLLLGSLVFAVPGPASAAGSPTLTKAQLFAQPLRFPSKISGAQINLTAAETDIQVYPTGPPTKMWTYNGQFPAPQIQATTGVHQEWNVTNNLPESAGTLTVHHHGEHAVPAYDGQPHEFLIDTGETYKYRFDFVNEGMNEPGRMQWYHDHMMDVTAHNVYMGLAGTVQLRNPLESAINAQLPSGDRDLPLVFADRTFNSSNQLVYEANHEGTLGDRVLTNGVLYPYFDVGDVKYRFRVLNASNFRFYELALSDGRPMTLVANESGLLPAPVTVNSITLGPAERAELIVDFSGKPLGSEVILKNLQNSGSKYDTDLMKFRVTRDENDNSTIPAVLKPVPPLTMPVARTRTWVLNNDPATGEWQINLRGYTTGRVDARPKLGTSERWVFVNTTQVPHVVHLHDIDWRLVSRNLPGADPRRLLADEAGWQEVFQIQPNETVTVIGTFTDHVGKYLLHCHLLEHEDHAMMTHFEVVS